MGMSHDFSSGTPTAVTVGATSTKIVEAKENRSYLVITNDSDEEMYISLGSAAVQGSGIPLTVKGSLIEISGERPFRGAVYGICASGGKSASVFEA